MTTINIALIIYSRGEILEQYEVVKMTTIRGARVKKILKMIRTYEVLFGEPHFPLSDLADETRIKQLKIKYYSINECTSSLKDYIDDVYERREYGKKEFNKKVFAGAKMLLVLKYVDHQLNRAYRNIDILSNHNSADNSLDVFKEYWEVQTETLRLLKSIILAQYFELSENEMTWINTIINGLVSDN